MEITEEMKNIVDECISKKDIDDIATRLLKMGGEANKKNDLSTAAAYNMAARMVSDILDWPGHNTPKLQKAIFEMMDKVSEAKPIPGTIVSGSESPYDENHEYPIQLDVVLKARGSYDDQLSAWINRMEKLCKEHKVIGSITLRDN